MTQSTLRAIYRLPAQERLRLATDILESIADEQDGSALTPDERLLIDERLALIEKHPRRGSTWPEVKKRLRRSAR
ncbi:MAG: addiction module protein [Planctomycetota bacterium]|nr:addiction module protein [Planctomycetota bacterium]